MACGKLMRETKSDEQEDRATVSKVRESLLPVSGRDELTCGSIFETSSVMVGLSPSTTFCAACGSLDNNLQ